MYFSKNGQIVSIVKSYFWSDSFILGLKWNFKYKPMRWLNQENPEMISFQIKLYLKYKRYICLIFLTILWTESKLSWYICDVIVTISRWRRKTKCKRSVERRGRDKYSMIILTFSSFDKTVLFKLDMCSLNSPLREAGAF